MIDQPTISVCICTCRRPELLLKLLGSLANQTYERHQFEVIVADNDRNTSAAPAIEQARIAFPELNLNYEVEPKSGVSFARNRTVARAQGRYLAFIDDDEFACPGWLQNLLATSIEFGADAVLGPVIPVFPDGSPPWTVSSGFFERPRFATGTQLGSGEGRTGNALVLAAFAKSRCPEIFAGHLAYIGGEDNDFFKWLVGQGGRMVWCDTAEVYEEVPLARQTLKFMLSRSFRTAAIYWQGEYARQSFIRSVFEAIRGFVGCGVLFLLGCLVLPVGLAKAVRFWTRGCRAAGRVGALFQLKPAGYGEGK